MNEKNSDEKQADRQAAGAQTYLANAGRRAEWVNLADGRGVVNPPVWRGSTILYEGVADLDAARPSEANALYYGRKGTPTAWALAEAITGLEPGAEGTILYPSGVAALAGAMLAVVKPGDHVLIPDSAYEPTGAIGFGYLARMGVEAEAYDPMISGEDIRALFRDNTNLLVLESPGSLTFEVQDVPGLAAAARKAGVATLLDNSWAASYFFKGIAAGCDMVMQAVTKYVGGHSDLLMGSVTATKDWFHRLQNTAWHLGQCVSPDDAALALRGLRTMGLRLERADQSARKLAGFLANHPLVDRVIHPAFPGCPGHAFFKRDFSGAAGLFGVVLKKGQRADTAHLCDDLRYFGIGFSWGGYESLILPTSPEQIRRLGAPDLPGPLMRVAVGLEDPEDLIADLAEGLARYDAAVPD